MRKINSPHQRKINSPRQDSETGEWRYNGKWWDYWPSEELEADEAALNQYWEHKQDERRDERL